eukprot:sb/3466768/
MVSFKLFLCVVILFTITIADHHDDGDQDGDQDEKPCVWATIDGYKVAGEPLGNGTLSDAKMMCHDDTRCTAVTCLKVALYYLALFDPPSPRPEFEQIKYYPHFTGNSSIVIVSSVLDALCLMSRDPVDTMLLPLPPAVVTLSLTRDPSLPIPHPTEDSAFYFSLRLVIRLKFKHHSLLLTLGMAASDLRITSYIANQIMSYGFPSTTGGNSGFSSSMMDDRNGKKKRPKCAKCRNHGIDVMRVGHKGSCSYEKCDCELCRQTRTRNDAMARTMANERARKKKETMFSNTTTPYTAFHQKTFGVPSAMHSIVSPVYKMEPIDYR